MNVQELVKSKLSDIKKMLFDEQQNFVEALLADGVTAVKIEPAIEQGAMVTVIDAEGNAVPAPEGEHQLADGTVIMVDGAGAITEIKSGDVDDEDLKKAQEEMAAQFKEIAEGVNAKIAEATSKFAEEIANYKKEAEDARAKFEEANKKSAEFQNQVFALLTKIADSELGDSSAASKQNFSKQKQKFSAKNEVDKFVNAHLQRINN